jgi:hypothetical protein
VLDTFTAGTLVTTNLSGNGNGLTNIPLSGVGIPTNSVFVVANQAFFNFFTNTTSTNGFLGVVLPSAGIYEIRVGVANSLIACFVGQTTNYIQVARTNNTPANLKTSMAIRAQVAGTTSESSYMSQCFEYTAIAGDGLQLQSFIAQTPSNGAFCSHDSFISATWKRPSQ